ncbi:MAG: hypothetical protein NT135_02820 [Candidatus Berkelbacteria bacterium]|nr:hypothetical protein [Candidatus Berkelbacteria bacterium]
MVWKIVLIIGIILLIVFGGYFGLAWVLRKANNSANIAVPNPTDSNQATTKQKAGNFDKNLVGTWVSDCLVPDEASPWSEKHQIVIKDDGSAVHTRFSNDSRSHDCTPNWQYGTATTNYQFTIPKTGQVNILYEGQFIYDIYQITGKDLLFGHGFQAHYPAGYDATQGQSESNRFHVLNTYIVYHKQ